VIELLEFSCGRCEAVNRLKFDRVLALQDSPKCGKCHEPLLRKLHEPLTGLDASSYTHPLDKEALEALKKLPGTRTFLKWIIKNSFEKEMRLLHHANYIQVSDRQVPSLHKRLRTAAERLGLSQIPDLFVFQHPVPNAYTSGVEEAFIAISTGCLELLTEEEQLGVLGHELGHVQADHVLYKTAARVFTQAAAVGAGMRFGVGAGALLLKPLQLALFRWDRASELTADRAELLVVRKPEVVLSALMKMAGGCASIIKELDIKAFIEQAEGFERMREENAWTKFIVTMQTMDRSHPFATYRARELLDFCSSGEFLEILDGDYAQISMVKTSPCPRCSKPLQQGAVICPHCAWGGEEDLKDAQAPNDMSDSFGDRMDRSWDDARAWFKRTFGSDSDGTGGPDKSA
jgi:Zn-dependent protease with chaperone function